MISVSSQPRIPSRLVTSTLAISSLLALSSCERIEERMPISEERELSSFSPAPRFPVTSDVRFPEAAAEAQAQTPAAAAGDGQAQENPLAWTTPEGWTVASGASGSMRLIDLRFGPNQEGECYLSAIPGRAGGLEANVNRWRQQMGQPAYSAEELAKLENKTFLGRPTPFVAFDGDYTNVGAGGASKGFRLLGLVQEAPEFTIFVKMTGPKEIVEKEAAAFEQFYQSIQIKR